MARDILALDARLKDLDTQIAQAFARHPQAAIIESMPGLGAVLGAGLLVGTAGLTAFPTAGHLAAAAGLAPVPNDSGRRTGNLHRPRRYHRPLRRVLYEAAQSSMVRPGPNRDYYLKKRVQGRTHAEGRHCPRPPASRRAVGAAAGEPHLAGEPTRAAPSGLMRCRHPTHSSRQAATFLWVTVWGNAAFSS
jgi:transposase